MEQNKTEEGVLMDVRSENATNTKRKNTVQQRCLGKVPARVVLALMAFVMFVVTQMVRNNIYIAIIAMVATENETEEGEFTKKLNWTKQQSGLVLGAFFLSSWITEIPGGFLAENYGGRRILFTAVLLAGIFNLGFPMACKIHYLFAMVLRVLQGLALGVTWPGTHALAAQWIPASELGRFMMRYRGEFIPGIMYVILALCGAYSEVVTAILFTILNAAGGASSSGTLANIIDLSPNFAGSLLGITKSLSVIPGGLSPVLVSMASTYFA